MSSKAVVIAELVAKGLSVYCATCSKYNTERGSCNEVCGSPLRGDAFSEYDGPISDHSRFCFVCGSGCPKYGVQLAGKTRILSICEKHVNWLENTEEDAKIVSASFGANQTLLVVKDDGTVKTAEEFFRRPLTIFERLAKADAESNRR